MPCDGGGSVLSCVSSHAFLHCGLVATPSPKCFMVQVFGPGRRLFSSLLLVLESPLSYPLNHVLCQSLDGRECGGCGGVEILLWLLRGVVGELERVDW